MDTLEPTVDEVEASLTPTEELFLEVLIARVRTGENVWTYGSNQTRTAKTLEAKGLISWKSGIVEKTILAWFTPRGQNLFLSKEYALPILKTMVPKEEYLKLELELLEAKAIIKMQAKENAVLLDSKDKFSSKAKTDKKLKKKSQKNKKKS